MSANVIIAPQLFSSLGQLVAKEQARVIDFINTFQANPANPGVSLERLTSVRSKNLWSGRISRALRAILHKDGETWAVLYAAHHDPAYEWAERREIGRHSITGALQIVEAIETVREVERIVEVLVQPKTPPTTEQIRRAADRMLGPVSDDMDEGEEQRTGTRSLLRGPAPRLVGHGSPRKEIAAAVAEIRRWLGDGLAAEAIGVFARTGKRSNELGRALQDADISWRRLSDKAPFASSQEDEVAEAGAVQLGTMHRAKGLEFKAVLVLGCGEEHIPSPVALRGIDDPQDREAAKARERRLLYVAMTRARDELTVSWSGSPSRFLAPLLATYRSAR